MARTSNTKEAGPLDGEWKFGNPFNHTAISGRVGVYDKNVEKVISQLTLTKSGMVHGSWDRKDQQDLYGRVSGIFDSTKGVIMGTWGYFDRDDDGGDWEGIRSSKKVSKESMTRVKLAHVMYRGARPNWSQLQSNRANPTSAAYDAQHTTTPAGYMNPTAGPLIGLPKVPVMELLSPRAQSAQGKVKPEEILYYQNYLSWLQNLQRLRQMQMANGGKSAFADPYNSAPVSSEFANAANAAIAAGKDPVAATQALLAEAVKQAALKSGMPELEKAVAGSKKKSASRKKAASKKSAKKAKQKSNKKSKKRKATSAKKVKSSPKRPVKKAKVTKKSKSARKSKTKKATKSKKAKSKQKTKRKLKRRK